jgi:hypothetical protein
MNAADRHVSVGLVLILAAACQSSPPAATVEPTPNASPTAAVTAGTTIAPALSPSVTPTTLPTTPPTTPPTSPPTLAPTPPPLVIDWNKRAGDGGFGSLWDDTEHPTLHSGVVFAHRFFVVGSESDESEDEIPAIWSSADGLAWDRANVPSPGRFSDLVAGPGALVAVGDPYQEDTPLWRTTDGVGWQRKTNDFGSQRISAASATDEGFVAFGSALWTSPDGLAWTETPSDSGLALAALGVRKIVRAGDRLVALAGGAAGAGGPISVWTSTNLVEWTHVADLDHSRNITSLVMASGPLGWLVAGSTEFGDGQVHRMWRSSDGMSWQGVPSPVGTVNDIFVDAVGFIAVGWVYTGGGCVLEPSDIRGLTWTSLDGQNWTDVAKEDQLHQRIDQLFRDGRLLIGLGLSYSPEETEYSAGAVWTFRLPPLASSGPGPGPTPTATPDIGGCG